jgi:isoleucyl-tRNA synthetase
LQEVGALIKEEKITHEYPHCWRCKQPVIFRSTEQWFISLDKTGLRQKSLDEIKKVAWIPAWGQERIYQMIANRPDWCISRQRAWGVPITVFFCRNCNHVLVNQEIIDHVCRLVEEHGADIWFSEPEEKLIPPGTTCPECKGTSFKKETDILDVWFDSGVSYAAVMEYRDYLDSPADLYLEGSDQHRGWFHSSLLCSVGTRGQAPYRSVVTHGFLLDKKGKAMHKSAGNDIAPEEIYEKSGAEIIRLWVAGEDYRDNIRLSFEILQRLTEAYRRIRNTSRYLLGNLNDFDAKVDAVTYQDMEELDRWALHRLQEVNERILKAYENFEFHQVFHTLHNFCVLDLSAFYLDIIKDRLYVSAPKSLARRSAQTAMNEILNVLVRLMAPVLSFTADEIWSHMAEEDLPPSVHADLFLPVKEEYKDNDLAERWEKIIKVRGEVTKALETARRNKEIGHSLDAEVTLTLPEDYLKHLAPYQDQLKTIFIVSSVRLVSPADLTEGYQSEEIENLRVKATPSSDKKCERCWVHDPTIGEHDHHLGLCQRCIKALDEMGKLRT